ncbi:unnamed protein product [Rotaria sp. Silwood1]|nr:unnamed protein product [Rotaria sp. Silwood1]CAF1303317.1 unnamed protein product [Rotaria sp. Silwood1]CAF3499503.1 unnamed protein product [Rotaria sp. Silwood1]CAF3524117.1 unnamed protein product [Rotaria sp. Silwood1]CAF3550044.1 unnamed protein product [Rotaria sp. Silwood1]
MFNILFLQLIFLNIIIINTSSKSPIRQYQTIFNKPQFYYQQQKQEETLSGQKWYYSSNQQPSAYSWYWTNNDIPSSNFYKNTLPNQQADQLSNWACGRSQVTNRFGRIMGGQNAVPHSYPWMVSLAKRSLNNLHLCGGVLLTRRHVLTAAHCIEDFKGISDINILAGIHYTNEKKTPISALSIDIHPQYDSETFANDVAIITLDTLLPENDPRIGTICLPPNDMMGKSYPPVKSSAVAIGWGSTSFGGRPSESLKQVVLPLLDTTKWPCNIYVTHAQGQICAGELNGGIDTCQADSGGPLMVENSDSRWEIIGITSFGKSCGKPDTPGIYTRVGTYNSFIRSIIDLSRNRHYYSSALPIYSNNFILSIFLIVSFIV